MEIRESDTVPEESAAHPEEETEAADEEEKEHVHIEWAGYI